MPGKPEDVDGIHIHSNKGGNYFKLGSRNLHAYWVTELVGHAMQKLRADTPEEFAWAVITQSGPASSTPGAVSGWPVAWSSDTLRVAREVQEVLVIGGRAEETDRYGNTVPVSPVTAPREFARVSTALATKNS